MATKVLVKDGKLATYGGKVVKVEATGAEAIEWHQCPEPVRNYLANVTYDPGDYSTSQIANYAPATAIVSNYKPIGQAAGGVTHYNEIPNVLTPFASGGKAGTPETLHWYQTITKNLTGCTLSNAASQVDYGEAYTATIAAESGKTITSVVVKMGGVDITATAYTASSGAINISKVTGAVTITAAASVPSVTYNITRNLTNCASSNTADTIAEGAAYTTTLSPTGTYKKLGAITVTMGGADISASAVSGSTITISKVTGNIVITCAAAITNIIDTIGISADTRLSTSSGANRTQVGYAAIGANMDASSLIHLKAGDTLRIKGASLPASNDSYSAIALHNASGTFNTSTYLHNGLTWNNMTFNNTDGGVIITSGGDHYFRVSMICADASKVVATINEAIE